MNPTTQNAPSPADRALAAQAEAPQPPIAPTESVIVEAPTVEAMVELVVGDVLEVEDTVVTAVVSSSSSPGQPARVSALVASRATVTRVGSSCRTAVSEPVRSVRRAAHTAEATMPTAATIRTNA